MQSEWQLEERTERPAVLGKITSARTLMLSPFVPHVAEEMWEKLGNKTRASKSSWPEAKDVQLGYDEMREDLFRRILDDISKILKVTKMSPKSITVYTAGAMKSDSYAYIVREVLAGSSNMGQIMPKLLSNPATQDIKKSPDYVQNQFQTFCTAVPYGFLKIPMRIWNRVSPRSYAHNQLHHDHSLIVRADSFPQLPYPLRQSSSYTILVNLLIN